MNKKISVIIPLYNKEHEIKRTLDSVLSQTFQDFEIIVVDDGSTDNGAEIVRGFNDPRIRLIQQVNQGVSAARNKGVHEALGDFIAFLDADDEWMPKHLETIIRLIEKHPGAGMYTTACKIRTPEGTTRWLEYEFIPDPPWEGLLPNYFKSGAVVGFPVKTSSVVIPKNIFNEAGGFPEGNWYGEDVDLFGKIALKYPVAFSWEFGALYHHDASNRASDKRIPLDYIEPFVTTARAALMKGEVPQEVAESLNEYICGIEILRAIRNVRAGHSETAQNILKQCTTRLFYFPKVKWLLLAKIPYPLFCFLLKIKLKFLKTDRNIEN